MGEIMTENEIRRKRINRMMALADLGGMPVNFSNAQKEVIDKYINCEISFEEFEKMLNEAPVV